MGIHLWGHDAGTEDQSYGSVHVDTRTNVQSQVALYHVRGPGTQYAPAKSSCQMKYFYRAYVQQYTDKSRYIKSVAFTSMHNSSPIE